jgi:polyhydroxybutyrate depolymerase
MLGRRSLLVVGAMAMLAVACSDGAGGDSFTATSTTSDARASSTSTSQPAVPPKPAVRPTAATIDATLRTPDGRDRTYHVYAPTSVTSGQSGNRVPLLVALHGGLGSGAQFERSSGFDGLAEANGFIVVYPDGAGVGPAATNKTWNAGACCGGAVRQGVDDVAFIRMLIERLQSTYPIEPARTYAAGHSNGGMLAYRLACELADEIVAVGVQSSALELDGCRPAQPVSLLHIHGAADENVPLAGGKGPKALSGVSYNPPMDGARTIARLDQCPTPRTSTDPSNPDISIETWDPCADGTEVRFLTVAGASHAWMGDRPARAGTTPYRGLDSAAVIWGFLDAHPRVG